MLGIFVDDMINVGNELPEGATYDREEKRIIVKENEERTRKGEVTKGDRRTMVILTEIANTIDLRMTSEVRKWQVAIPRHPDMGRGRFWQNTSEV